MNTYNLLNEGMGAVVDNRVAAMGLQLLFAPLIFESI